MFYLILFSLSCIFLSWLFLKWEFMKNYWKKMGVPHTPIHPIFGSMTFLQRKNPGIWLCDMYQKYPFPYVGIWIFWRRGLLINSPDLAKQILVKDADVFRNRLIGSGKSDPMGALNLFTADDPLWSSIRKRLTTVFTASKLRGWNELYKSKVADLVHRIHSDNEKGIRISLRGLFADFSTDIIGESSFGILCQATRTSRGPLRAMTQEFEKYSTWRGMAWCSIFFLPEFVDWFRFSLWPKRTVKYFKEVFETMVAKRGGYEMETDGKRDLLDVLIKMRQDSIKENQELDLDVVLANALVFLQGGYDTSSASITWTIYELAHHPEYQQILYDELVEARQKLGGKEFDSADLAELPYLDAVIKEALRKHPIMGWMDRVALKPYKIDDKLTVPTGTVIYVNAIGMHRDPKYFSDPRKYRPDRFLPENAKNILPYTYLPFGDGPRVCIGKRIGQNTVRHAVSSVILNFEVRALPNTPAPNDVPVEKKGLFYVPGVPLSVEFIPRNKTL